MGPAGVRGHASCCGLGARRSGRQGRGEVDGIYGIGGMRNGSCSLSDLSSALLSPFYVSTRCRQPSPGDDHRHFACSRIPRKCVVQRGGCSGRKRVHTAAQARHGAECPLGPSGPLFLTGRTNRLLAAQFGQDAIGDRLNQSLLIGRRNGASLSATGGAGDAGTRGARRRSPSNYLGRCRSRRCRSSCTRECFADRNSPTGP